MNAVTTTGLEWPYGNNKKIKMEMFMKESNLLSFIIIAINIVIFSAVIFGVAKCSSYLTSGSAVRDVGGLVREFDDARYGD